MQFKYTKNKKDDAAVSVVGEMLLLALVLILVSLFAASAFDLLPGERVDVVDVSLSYNTTEQYLYFWHKGGDWIDGSKLSAALTTAEGKKYTLPVMYLTDYQNETKLVFDLGGRYVVKIPAEVIGTGTASIRLTTESSVIYAKEMSI